jgi:hypothetical protein
MSFITIHGHQDTNLVAGPEATVGDAEVLALALVVDVAVRGVHVGARVAATTVAVVALKFVVRDADSDEATDLWVGRETRATGVRKRYM